jgi:DNA excision repair protein ERCC-6-like 2
MSGRRLQTTGSRRLTREERVNIEAGEDGMSDSGDLDMVPERNEPVGLSDHIESFGPAVEDAVNISSDAQDDDASSDAGGKKRKRVTTGERIAFDDEDPDAAYQAWKRQKSQKRKAAAASTRRAKSKTGENAPCVGLKPKTIIPLTDSKQRNGEKIFGQEGNSDEDPMETTLPDYLKKRRSKKDERWEKLGTKGLQVPPEYDDIDFSDDEDLAHLRERPQLPESYIQREYKDVVLKYSLGVIPAPIAQYLRQYQIEGAEYLHRLFVYQEGGILGDDMGLGKTIQVIAFLTAAFGKTGDERDAKRMRKVRRKGDRRYPRVLLIAPSGLMNNWKNELRRWGWWHIYVYHGSAKEKQEAVGAAQSGRLEIMITTYASYRLNMDEINTIRWDAVIADECHQIKTKGSETTKAMNDVNALCRIGMTGTAIQNKYEELWTLLNWTNPGRFGPISTWKQSICIPLKIGQSHDATYAQLAKARRTATKLVNNLLPPFFLRRTKDLIKDQLPKKSDRVVFCPLTETQEEAYDNFCDSEIVRAIRDSGEPCWCGSGKKQGWCCNAQPEGYGKWQHFVFPCLVTLQKLANHLALLIPAGEADKDRHDKDLEKMQLALPGLWKDLYRNRDSILNYAKQDFCGKWRVLKKLLKLWHDNGDKVLIFSHSVRLLKMLKTLFSATTSYNVSYLDGSLKLDERQEAVDNFNSDPGQFVFLISTKAGGVGLNITSANKVVVVDPNWNPAYDLQAQDRAYRIGQTRDVEVFRLVSKGTVEEIVYARQIYKQQQANIGYNASVERRYFKGVQDQKDMKGEIFGLANLFKPVSENVVLRDIVNKTNVAETRAGVEIAGLDFEASQEDDDEPDESKETAAMSQLAAHIIDEPAAKRKFPAKRKDPVSAILASVGVEYTHENAEVIGTSKIETKISSRAQKAGNDIDYDQHKAFGTQSSQLDAPSTSNGLGGGLDGVDREDGLAKIRYRYRPPPDVRKRQFCSMAKHFGYDDVAEFALVVEGWTQGQRRDCLEKFYRDRRGKLGASPAG